jgi:hypothetical protein
MALAKSIVNGCTKCRRESSKMQHQIMADLRKEKVSPSVPFVVTAVDLFSSFQVRRIWGRRYFPVWGVLYTCLSTKAVAILACPGYDTETFLCIHTKFCSLYGVPSRIYANHGPQLTAAAGPNWDKIRDELGQQGTEWKFTLKECSWRIGQVESCIKMAK